VSVGLVIRGGRVIDPANAIDAVRDVYISRGKIAGVGRKPRDLGVDRRIDARGLLVLPGLIDLCARGRAGALEPAGKDVPAVHHGEPRGLQQAALAARQGRRGYDGLHGVPGARRPAVAKVGLQLVGVPGRKRPARALLGSR